MMGFYYGAKKGSYTRRERASDGLGNMNDETPCNVFELDVTGFGQHAKVMLFMWLYTIRQEGKMCVEFFRGSASQVLDSIRR